MGQAQSVLQKVSLTVNQYPAEHLLSFRNDRRPSLGNLARHI